MSGLPNLIHAALATPWAIQPERLAAIADVLARRAAGEKLDATEIRARVGDAKGAPQQGAGVAVLPLYGIIGHRMNQVQDISGPGGTSTEQFGAWFDAALNDPAIGAIVIDVDSPGGSVGGVPELAAKIAGARGVKPVVAIANGLAASAAYWIASAAEEFWVTPSGDVGSIGVYTMHQDLSAAYADAGVVNTLISAGKHKVEGNPYAPLDDEARAAIQERVDEIYGEFVKAVAAHRGVDASDVQGGFGEGRVVGAVRAKRLGMVDKIGTMDTLLGRLGAGGSRSRLKATDLAPTPQLTAGALERLEAFEEAERLTDLGRAAVETFAVGEGMVLGYVEAPIGTPDSEITAAIAASGMVAPGRIAARVAEVLETQGRADVAAAPVVIPIHGADEAKEFAMSDKGTPAAVAADPAALAAVQEKNRITALTQLAGDEGVPVATLSAWINGNLSVEAAQKSLLDAAKAARAEAPAIRSTIRPLDGGDNGTKAGPFRTLGEQLTAVIEAGRPGGRVDPKLFVVNDMSAASGASATVGADGGFLIQKDFAVDLMKEGTSGGVLAPACSSTEISANSDGLEVPYINETSRATGSRWGGVRVYRRAEADTVTASKPQLDKWECRLEDLMGLAYVTERLMRDASAIGSVFSEAFRDEFAFVIDDEIYRGTGVGQCLGILNADATVSVAKETGQAADTIVAENVIKMWSRVPLRSRTKGFWVYNIEAEPQLQTMTIGTGTSATLVFMPPTGLTTSPYATIYGRPALPIEHASALGDVGDIAFLDLSQYKLITKGGIEEEESIHVRFLYNERALRWNASINGAPKLKSAITPYKGSANATQSPFVTLAAR